MGVNFLIEFTLTSIPVSHSPVAHVPRRWLAFGWRRIVRWWNLLSHTDAHYAHAHIYGKPKVRRPSQIFHSNGFRRWKPRKNCSSSCSFFAPHEYQMDVKWHQYMHFAWTWTYKVDARWIQICTRRDAIIAPSNRRRRILRSLEIMGKLPASVMSNDLFRLKGLIKRWNIHSKSNNIRLSNFRSSRASLSWHVSAVTSIWK